MGPNTITDYDGRAVLHQPSKCVVVDFINDTGYSESASDTTGYYDVYEELGVDWAFIQLDAAADLDVEFLDDDTSVVFPFQVGTNEHKIKRIYYNASNGTNKFWLVYTDKG